MEVELASFPSPVGRGASPEGARGEGEYGALTALTALTLTLPPPAAAPSLSRREREI